jgi:hypothetical protein
MLAPKKKLDLQESYQQYGRRQKANLPTLHSNMGGGDA